MAVGFQRAVEERIRAIAGWRREREFQDMMGLGPEAAARSRRSADGLDELASAVAALPKDDDRLASLQRLCGGDDWFDPGARVLEALGQFRFHRDDVPVDGFISAMVDLAGHDREEVGQWGGPQIAGDDPWRSTGRTWEDDEDEW